MVSIFIKILNMSITASWLILAVMLLRALLKKSPRWMMLILWGLVGLRLILPFSVESDLSLIPEAGVKSTYLGEEGEDLPEGITSLNYIEVSAAEEDDAQAQADYASENANAVSAEQDSLPAQAELSSANETEAAVNFIAGHSAFLSIIWVLGVAVILLYMAGSSLRLRSRLNTAIRLEDNIYQSEYAMSPFLLGLIRPRIYIPFSLTEEEREFVVAHERAHIARGDHWIKAAGFALLALHWFNPLVWWAYSALCRDVEEACDERVIRGIDAARRADYAQALLSCEVSRMGAADLRLAFGRVCVKKRVRHILRYKKPTARTIALTIVVCLALTAGFLTNPNVEFVSASEEKTAEFHPAIETEYVKADLTEHISVDAEVTAESVYAGEFGLYRYTVNTLEGSENITDTAVISQTMQLALAVDAVLGTDYASRILPDGTGDTLSTMQWLVAWPSSKTWFYSGDELVYNTYTQELEKHFPFWLTGYDEEQAAEYAQEIAAAFSEFILFDDYTYECVSIGGDLYAYMEEFYEKYGLYLNEKGVAGVTAQTEDSYEIVLRPTLDHGVSYRAIEYTGGTYYGSGVMIYLNRDYEILSIRGINSIQMEDSPFETTSVLTLAEVLSEFCEEHASDREITVVKAELCYTACEDTVRGTYVAPCWILTYCREGESGLRQCAYRGMDGELIFDE